MIVKVCGLTEIENINAVAALGADLLGFVFYNKSPRCVKLTDPQFIAGLKSQAYKVGVFVNADVTFIREVDQLIGLKFIQLHGNESPEFCHELKLLGYQVVKAFSIDDSFDFNGIAAYEGFVELFIFDNKDKSRIGGTGKSFNWKLLERYQGQVKFLLSGGIGPENINSALAEIAHPMFAGVDINSAVEISPGVKDIEKLKGFFKKLSGFGKVQQD